MEEQRIVTLTTDFGINDYYVGAMRGVILSINPQAQITDICNTVQSFDILDGAMTIAQTYKYFPSNTVHVVIVDPGVGGSRHPLLVATERHYFLAPDNGVLSLVYEQESRVTVRRIDASHYFLHPVSQTFEGRDVFAPVAGWLSKGMDPAKFGEITEDYVRFSVPKPKIVSKTAMAAIVLKTDKFGNLITNIHSDQVPQLFESPAKSFKITIGNAEVTSARRIFSEGAAGELFVIAGSLGYLEIVSNMGSAAALAQAGKGSELQLAFDEEILTPPVAK